ncbi:hypothetical protein PMAYCL1PPCAC_05661 [Pristionchus mayeri]|uniref:Uncharacterized protein n=1 Tax=Pristionchus mayeri TaxID=1317129 RepID=A0AAN5CBS3_9BILA|nr:hypothetical protein PMAYCL1PPCAC_05661 [Pristionchus mayeri]
MSRNQNNAEISKRFRKYLFQVFVRWLLKYGVEIRDSNENKVIIIIIFIFTSVVGFLGLILFVYVNAKLAAYIKERDEARQLPEPLPKYVETPPLIVTN